MFASGFPIDFPGKQGARLSGKIFRDSRVLVGGLRVFVRVLQGVLWLVRVLGDVNSWKKFCIFIGGKENAS